MKPGDLVRFNVSAYFDLGFGIILREYDMVDRDGVLHPGFYYVLTRGGEKLISDSFMELVSDVKIPA